MKEIILKNRLKSIVDDEDFEWLFKLGNWNLTCKKYARNKYGLMHQLIYKKYYDFNLLDEIDHINRNPLDNRKENLRLVNHRINCLNRGPNKNNTSGYKGVYWNSRREKWMFAIYENKSPIKCGYFKEKRDAAIAYDLTMKEILMLDVYENVPDATEIEKNKIKEIINNPKKHKGNSKYKGVCYNKKRNQWQCYITINNRMKHLGWFETEEKAYNQSIKFIKNNE